MTEKRNLIDGKTWTYNSARAWSAFHPYLSEQMVYRALRELEEEGVIVSGNHNKHGYDRTKWYAFVDEESFLQPRVIHLSRTMNGTSQNDETIPDSLTDTKTDKKKVVSPSRGPRDGIDKNGNKWKGGVQIGHYDGARFIPAS